MDDEFDLTAELAKATEEARRAAAVKPEEQLGLVKAKCEELAQAEGLTLEEQMILARTFADGLSISTRDQELQSLIEEAVRGQAKPIFYRKGDRLRADDPCFLVDGLVRLNSQNLIVGQPKVGKSSFVAGLVAALRDGRDDFAGAAINKPSSPMPVLIFGTDQQEGDWLYYLRREGLVAGEKSLLAPLEFFCSVDGQEHFNFTASGVKLMRDEIARHDCPLVIIDSLSSMMEPTGIEEGLGQYGGAIRKALRVLSETGATIIVLHHTTKVVTTWDWVEECRGGTRLSSIPGWGVLMRWLTLEEDATMRMDRRVGISGKGRGSGTGQGLLAEYTDDHGWVAHGDLAGAQRVERVKEKYLNLQGVRMAVMDHVVMAHEMGRPVCAASIGGEINKTTSNVARELALLKGMGLIELDHKEATGARPRVFWRLTEMAQTVILLTHDPSATTPPRRADRGSFDSFDGGGPIKSKESCFSPLRGGEEAGEKNQPPLPAPNSPVELLQSDGSWLNGWKLHKDSTAHAVSVWRLDGNGNLTKRNGKRWGIDVRACQPAPLYEPFNPDTLDF